MNSASGPSPSNTPGTPRRKEIRCTRPSRSTSTSSRELSALTTLAPTPCSPPEAVYEPPPNLPPACSLVITTSTPVSRVRGSTSTGMPRPSSWTSTDPSHAKDHVDPSAPTTEGLVDRVVQDLPQAVHQPAGVRRPDVHPGALAHRFEALEHGQVLRRVPGCGLLGAPAAPRRLQGFCSHLARVPGPTDSGGPPSDDDIPWRMRRRMQVARLANVPADVCRGCHTGEHKD